MEVGKHCINLYVTDWGNVEVMPYELAEAGLWARADKTRDRLFPRKHAALLHDFLSYYARDDLYEWRNCYVPKERA